MLNLKIIVLRLNEWARETKFLDCWTSHSSQTFWLMRWSAFGKQANISWRSNEALWEGKQGQIHLVIWTNTFWDLSKYILQLSQIHVAIWRNIFWNSYKSFSMQRYDGGREALWEGKHQQSWMVGKHSDEADASGPKVAILKLSCHLYKYIFEFWQIYFWI